MADSLKSAVRLRKNPALEHGWMEGNSRVTVGRFTYGHEHLTILQWGEGAALRIGSFCSIARDVSIFLGGDHRLDWASTFPFGHIFSEQLGGESIKGHPASKGEVVIGHDVWIGRGATIMSGVSIGNGAVIAANSHVVADVAPYSIAGGNPAREIRQRFMPEQITLLQLLAWWELPVDTIARIAAELSAPPALPLLRDLIRRYRA